MTTHVVVHNKRNNSFKQIGENSSRQADARCDDYIRHLFQEKAFSKNLQTPCETNFSTSTPRNARTSHQFGITKAANKHTSSSRIREKLSRMVNRKSKKRDKLRLVHCCIETKNKEKSTMLRGGKVGGLSTLWIPQEQENTQKENLKKNW